MTINTTAIRLRIPASTDGLQSLLLSPLRPAFQTSSIRLRWHRQHTTRVQVQRSSFQQPPQTEPPPKTYFQQPSDPPKTYFQPPPDPPPPPSYFQLRSHPPPPPIPPPRHHSKLRILAWAGFFLSLGYYAGTATLDVLFPTSSLSHPDVVQHIRTLNAELNRLPIVKELRRNPELWQEQVAYSSLTPEERQARLTSGAMSTPEAVPVQRIFMNKKDGKVVNVVWFGNSVSGWPRIVHGGALAVILDETMGRVALFHLAAKTGVTATLEIAYRRIALTNQFFIVRADLVREGSSERKAVVRASIETPAQGGPFTEAKALFVTPRKLKLEKLKEGF